MAEIGVVGILFLLSLVANALVTRWSAKRVLGIEVSLLKSGLIVTGRSLAALLAGFAIGYIIRLSIQSGDNSHQAVQIMGMGIVALLSFGAYWALLGKITNTSISLWGMTKTVATETVMLVVTAFGIAIILSTIFYTFQ